jgi:hypothetical protein
LKVQFAGPALKAPVCLTAHLDVAPLVLKPSRDFLVTHWWCADALYDWYKLDPFGEKWFKITRPYLEDMIDHGSNVILVPLFYVRREIVERPGQLLLITEPTPGHYVFDWSRVRQFVRLAKSVGFEHFEWSHLWSVAGNAVTAENTTRIYTYQEGRATLIWPPETKGNSAIYRHFLEQFLPEFHEFLSEEGILEQSLFHLADEPGGRPQDMANYRQARQWLRELAPWMKVMDALSNMEYASRGMTDLGVPAVNAAKGFRDAGLPHWVYYCCLPRGNYLNRFFDTPLPKIRMSGWLFYRLGAKGFLHWGFNYWYMMDLGNNKKSQVLLDPFSDGAAGGANDPSTMIPYGDPFVVYPGPNGPIDSIRWEVFAESLQDYALLQTAGIKPDDPLLAPIKDYADFPRSEEWIETMRGKIISR